ncbi:hypothetical protein [Haloferax sulfurifontis]|nr:hypothetical protein [Haloferax sulfurifontis]ELZ96605.1 hypothetical protein C441_04534 [Haloferax sulfurifontis ATCC BAA-897]
MPNSNRDRSATELSSGTVVPNATHVRECASVRDFVSVWRSQPAPARRLWEVISAGGAVGIELSNRKARDLGTSTGVICRIAATTGSGTDDGAYLLRDGACAREVERMIRNRNKLVDHRAEARFCQTDADVDALSDQIQAVNAHISTRDVLDTSFDEEWVPRSCVTRVVVSASLTGGRRDHSSRQTSLEGI